MKVSRFEDLLVWQKSRALAAAVYRSTMGGRFAKDFGLRDQIRRAAVSVMSNIAEGFGRHSRADMRHFLAMARGSAFEIRSQLYLARDLDYLQEHEHRALHDLCVEVSRMLAAMRSSLQAPEQRR
jgi:four helix bundle protein